MCATILVVDDEKDLVTTLEYNLRREGHSTRSALTGREALEQAALDPPPDLVLLDIMLPDMPGTEVCRALRSDERTRAVPVVMVTARTEELDRVVGFEVGADDYVVKPFSVRELMLRVRAILRRSQAGDSSQRGRSLSLGRVKVDTAAHKTWVDDEEIALTALEFKLLATLLARRGRVQTRDALLFDVWGYQAFVTTRTVDTHVKRLRQKLGPAGDYIETVRGVGYRLRTDAAEDEDES